MKVVLKAKTIKRYIFYCTKEKNTFTNKLNK